MKWLWITLCISALAVASYYYSVHAPQPRASHELHETKAILMTKTRDHEALWVHYKYTDLAGNSHEMSEKVHYIDVWEKFSVGQEVDIIYNDEGLSVLKIAAHAHAAINP